MGVIGNYLEASTKGEASVEREKGIREHIKTTRIRPWDREFVVGGLENSLSVEDGIARLWSVEYFDFVATEAAKLKELMSLSVSDRSSYSSGLLGSTLSQEQQADIHSIGKFLTTLHVVQSGNHDVPFVDNKSDVMTYVKWMGIEYIKALLSEDEDLYESLMGREEMVIKTLNDGEEEFCPDPREKEAILHLFDLIEQNFEGELGKKRSMEEHLASVLKKFGRKISPLHVNAVEGAGKELYSHEVLFSGDVYSDAHEVLAEIWPDRVIDRESGSGDAFFPGGEESGIKIFVSENEVRILVDKKFLGYLIHAKGLNKALKEEAF